MNKFRIADFECPVAATLTLKKSYRPSNFVVWLTPIEASKNLRHFLNLLNRKLFGKSGVRAGKSVKCYPVLEGDGRAVRFHYHLCLDKPNSLTLEEFANLIRWAWLKTNFGYREIDAKACDSGWTSYMTKYKSKVNFADAIDWMNFNNSRSAV